MKDKILRIFPTLKCNYKCDYCTVFNQFNTELDLNFNEISADTWLKALNDNQINERYEDYGIIISGGEPTLYKQIKQLCDNLVNRKIHFYTNVSEKAYEVLMTFEKPVFIYPSLHIKEELKRNHTDIFKKWYGKLINLKEHGHYIYTPHVPDDGTKQIEKLPEMVMRTRIEGIINNQFYSPYVNECRVLSKETKKVQCSTIQLVIAPDGNIYNCQAGMFSQRKDLILGNINNFDWTNIPEWIECNWCGKCHPCSQLKVIQNLDGSGIMDFWQYKPVLENK